jgi:hypothetical protein
VKARSPWLVFTNIKVRGLASYEFSYNIFTSLSWDPTFKINEATVNATVNAALEVEYETNSVSNTINLVNVALSGELTLKTSPAAELHGNMNASITILNYAIAYSTGVHYDLSSKQIIN